jgi:hypothetical protein
MRNTWNRASTDALAPTAKRAAGVVRPVIARNGGELPAAPH